LNRPEKRNALSGRLRNAPHPRARLIHQDGLGAARN